MHKIAKRTLEVNPSSTYTYTMLINASCSRKSKMFGKPLALAHQVTTKSGYLNSPCFEEERFFYLLMFRTEIKT